MPGTLRDASRCSHPRMPVPMEAKRTVSLGATRRGVPESRCGCSILPATVEAAITPVPSWMNLRRESGLLAIECSPFRACRVLIDYAREKCYGWELSHKNGMEAKTILFGIETILEMGRRVSRSAVECFPSHISGRRRGRWRHPMRYEFRRTAIPESLRRRKT